MSTGFLVGLSLVTLSAAAHARCAEATIQVSGEVVGLKDAPLESAKVVIEWSEIDGLVNRVTTATTDSKGRFNSPIVFYPWREPTWWFGRYRCDSPPPLLKLQVEAVGYSIHKSTAQSKYEGTELHVSLSAR
jgi:hypothetical protein